MPVIYGQGALTRRSLGTRDAIDAAGGPGRLEFLAPDGVTIRASVTLGYPGDATALVDGPSLTLAGFPRADQSVDSSGPVGSARIVDAIGGIVVEGMSVGTLDDGSEPAIVLEKLDLIEGEILRIMSARVGPPVAPTPEPPAIPVLTLLSADATSPTTAAASVNTDHATGTLFYLVSANPAEPVSAIKAGASVPVTVSGPKTVSLSGLAASTAYYVHFVHTSAAGGDSTRVSSPSFTTPAVVDSTDPELSDGASTATGSRSAIFGVTTNEGNGTLYLVVTTSATPPTAAQVRAGQNHAGTAAVFAASQVASTAGAKSAQAIGLTAATTYYGYWTQRDGSGNDSAVEATPSVATNAAPSLTSPSATQTGTSTATLGVTTNNGTGSLYAVVTTSATPPSVQQVISGLDHTGAAAKFSRTVPVSGAGTKTVNATGLVAATPYWSYFVHRDVAGSDSAVSTGVSFTTASSPPVDPPPVDPPPVYTDVLPTILTDTGTGGPTQHFWCSHLGQRWVTNMGDWKDSLGVAQGNTPFASVLITATGEYALDVTDIVKSGDPIILRLTGKNSPTARFAGRGSATPPRIVATNSVGAPVAVDVLAYACWNSSTASATSTYTQGSISTIANGAVSYEAGPDVQSAILYLTCNYKGTPNGTLGAYRCNVTPLRIGSGGAAPTLGLAAEAGSEAALSTHPDVYVACDFSAPGDSFVGYGYNAGAVPEILDDPDSPGRKIIRHKFTPLTNGSMSFGVQTASVDLTDPMRPIKFAPQEMYCRLEVFIEDDWIDVYQDAQKMGIGFDQRFGYWTSSGYWQETTGNGGIRGTGLKIARPGGHFNQMPDPRWEYQGHLGRMEIGRAPIDPANPYRRYRPIQSYVYHLDQFDANGQFFNFSGAAFPIGRWVCVEQYIRTNSINGPFDEVGNGEAVADGVLRTWIDGVPCGEVTNLRWRRHADIGIEGPRIVWYYGGKTLPPHEMHYRMRNFVAAKRYIGPPGVLGSPQSDAPSTPPVTDGSLAAFAAAIGLEASPTNRWIDTNIKPGRAWAVRSMVPGARDATQAEVEPGPADVGNFTALADDTLQNSNGAAFFPTLKRFYWCGGGHGGWPGNEVYWTDVPSRRWGRLNNPSPMERWPGSPSGWGWRNTDGTWKSAHTYNGIVAVEAQNCFYIVGGAPWPDGGFPRADIWRFNVVTKVWTEMLQDAFAPLNEFRGSEAIWVPSQQKIAIGQPNFWRWYDPFTNALGPQLGSQSTLSNGNSVGTPNGIYSFGNNGTCFFMAYANIGSAAPVSVNTTTHPRIRSHPRWLDAGHQWNSFLWDANRNMVIAWSSSYTSEPTVSGANKGRTVYAIDFTNDHLYEFVVSGGSHAQSSALGSFTRWQHLTDLDVYVGLNNRAISNGWMVFKPGTLTQLT